MMRRITAPEAPVQRLFDEIDFQRGRQVVLQHLMAADVWGFRQAFTPRRAGRRDRPRDVRFDANGPLLTYAGLTPMQAISATELATNLTAQQTATAGTLLVTVKTPAPGGVSDPVVEFIVTFR
jgi:hypothetical protein